MVAGNTADIAFAIQAAKGTPATASSQRLYLMGGGVAAEKEAADIEETGSGRLRNSSFVRVIRAGGSPSFVVRPASIPLLLYGVMGAKAVTGAADPYLHTITLAQTQPWLTVWRMLGGGLFERFTDCKISSLTLRSAAGGLLVAEVSILGLSPAYKTAAEATASPETTNAFIHADGTGALLYEGAAVAAIESFSLAINSNASLQQGDAVTGNDVSEGMHDITLETVQTITNFAIYNRFVYGSASPADNATPSRDPLELAGAPAGIDFKWTRPGSPARSLEILAPRVQVTAVSGIEANVNGDPIKSTTTHKVYAPASGSGLTAKVQNAVASYTAS